MEVEYWMCKGFEDMKKEVVEVDDDLSRSELKDRALSFAFREADIEYGFEIKDEE